MVNTIYQNAKALLIKQAKEIKRTNSDKGYIRYELNNLCDSICRQFNYYAMKEVITEKRAALYCRWIDSLTASLHPKD